MPLPTRNVDEPHDQFIERCMGDPVMVRDFPDTAQRRAVCERQANMQSAGVLNLVSEPGAITIEAAADGTPEGQEKPRLPRFSMIAYTGGPMRIAGWHWPVIVDLAGLSIPSQSRPIRFGHDMQSGVGHSDAIRVEDGKLIAAGVVSRDTAAAKEIVVSARNGFPWQASIAAAVEEFEFVKESQKTIVNGREFLGPVNVVRKSTLGEISFVDLGADGQTSASVAAAAPHLSQEKTKMNENVMTNSETAGAQTTEVPAAATTANPPAEASQPSPTATEIRAAALAETNRVAAIREICAGRFPKIEAQAISEGWDATRCELEVLRANRPRASSVSRWAATSATAATPATRRRPGICWPSRGTFR